MSPGKVVWSRMSAPADIRLDPICPAKQGKQLAIFMGTKMRHHLIEASLRRQERIND